MTDNNEKNEFEVPEGTAQPAQYNWNEAQESKAAETDNPVMLRRRIKGGYNQAVSIMLWQLIFSVVAMLVFQFAYSSAIAPSIMAENPNISSAEFTDEVSSRMSEGAVMILMNVVSVIPADIIAVVIVYFAAKRFKFKELIHKPDFPKSGIALAACGILGLQGLSVFVQGAVTLLTDYTGINEALNSAMSFTDNTASNILLAVYLVLAAPVLEEIMFRGLVMNLFAPVNRTFALFASALLFGLMHGNFNQIFNGFLLGLLLGYIALKSGSIVSSIICHVTANLNAALMSYIFEYRLYNSIGDSAYTYEFIIFAAELVIGCAALFFLLKKHGKVKQTDIIVVSYTYELEAAEEKKLTWSLLLKSPLFWLIVVIYIGNACMMVTGVSM